MFTNKDAVRAVVSLVVAVIVAAILCMLVNMSDLMGKFIIPVIIFLGTFYLLRKYWSVNIINALSTDDEKSSSSSDDDEKSTSSSDDDKKSTSSSDDDKKSSSSSKDAGVSKDNGKLEEGLSPQFLNYGHTNFGNQQEMYVDDPDSTVTILPPDHPQYSELYVPREQVIEPEAFNAANVNDGYAYVGGNNQPQFGNESSSADSPCAVGGSCSSYLCSETDVKNPLNLVASTPGPWQVQRAAAIQQRLVEGRYVPTTPMV